VTGAGIASAVHSGRLAGQAASAAVAGNADAAEDYEDELDSVYRPALERALRRRRELAALSGHGMHPPQSALRRAWIAYPEYWAAQS
jgi:flavin-dependent dehydrogenase